MAPIAPLRGAAAMTALAALAAVLDDLAVVVDSLSDTQYEDSAIPGVSGSVGGHVRHCLDHVRAVERSLDTGIADYEARDRNALLEVDRTLAWSLLLSARRRITRLPVSVLARPVVVRVRMHANMGDSEVLSTVEREVSFVIAHTIHHCAMIAVLAGLSGESAPARFGFAPGTPAVAVRVPCAR